jgi:FkbM family methyltransferase
MKLQTKIYDPPPGARCGLTEVVVYYRPGTSDEDALHEVLINKTYRRARSGFDVLPGEHWLDLGANIGAFAIYCQLRGAKVTCYEPMLDCFEILTKNHPDGPNILSAVTASKLDTLPFFTSSNDKNHWRGTMKPVQGYKPAGVVRNTYGGAFQKMQFDGVKMDIEGAEGELIDSWLLPPCEKLVLEYHTSRCSSVTALERRIKELHQHFTHVMYPKEFDRVIAEQRETYQPRFDKLIFCWGAR